MRTKAFKNFLILCLSIVGFAEAVFGASESKNIFRFRLNDDPITLDWNKAHTTTENYILMNIMEGLVELDSDLRVIPSLADRWNITNQGKVYTFSLRKGVYWSDGVKLKAKDFVESWKRLLDPKTAAPYAYLLFDIEGAEDFHNGKFTDFSKVGVKAINDSTLVVRLKTQTSHWIYIPSFWVTFPIRKDVINKHGEGWTQPGKMISLGPYLLKEQLPGSSIKLERNKRYHGKIGNLDEIDALIIKNDHEALKSFESNKLDYMGRIPSSEMARVSKMSEFKSFQAIRTIYWGMVQNKNYIDLHLRKALASSIERGKIPEILNGGQIPAGSFTPPGVMGYSSGIGIEYNPKKAKEELKRSLYNAKNHGPLEMLVIKTDQSLKVTNYLVKEVQNNIGVEIKVTALDSKDFYKERKKRIHSLFEGTWGADYPDPDNILSIFTSISGNNHLLWTNAKYDELIQKGKWIKQGYEREASYVAAQRLIQEQEVGMLPLYYDTENVLIKSRIKNLVLSPVSYLFLKQVSLK